MARPEIIPGWTSSMEGEPPIGLLPDGTLNITSEDEDEEAVDYFKSANDDGEQLIDYNKNHEPAGSEKGGEFASGEGEEFGTYENPDIDKVDELRAETIGEPPPLAPGEIKQIKKYSDDLFDPINHQLRTGGKDYNDSIARIDAAMDRAKLPHALDVYRSFGQKTTARLKKLNDGDIFEDKGYVSTSLTETTFSEDRGFGSNKHFRITVPKGYKALPLGSLSQNPNELEVILKRGTKFRVHKKASVIRLEVVK